MKELEFIKSITNIIGNDYIGDDCSYLKDLGIVITQDSLVENIHFKRCWTNSYKLGYKSVAVNISDILASGAAPKYVTIALSLPSYIDNKFISEFYSGASHALYGAKIVGGDITGSINDIVVSVAAIGSVHNRNISSRKNARPGYAIITSGFHGSSAYGLAELSNGITNSIFVKAHLEPSLDIEFSNYIASNVKEPYAMMDSSDGLADALFKIAEASNVSINIDYNLIKHYDCVSKNQVLFGGEDYKLVAAIPQKYLSDFKDVIVIGQVSNYNGIRLEISGEKYTDYSQLNVYNHFNNI